MKFEYRILSLLLTVIVSGFTFLNFVSIAYIREVLDQQLQEKAKLYSKLILYNRTERIPEFIKIEESPLPLEKHRLILYTGKHYVFIKEEYIRNLLLSYGLSLFLWEGGLTVIILLLFYLTLIRNLKTEKETGDLLNVMLQSLTHKIGNFLASQKINLEMLEESSPVLRMKRSLSDLERNYQKTFKILEMLRHGQHIKKEKIDLLKLISDTALSYKSIFQREVFLRTPNTDFSLNSNPFYTELLVSLLLENAFKHSDKRVFIKLCRARSKKLLIVKNDIGRDISGTGVGLRIVKFIADKLGVDLKIRIRKNFTVLVTF